MIATLYHRLKSVLQRYVRSDDTMATLANTGALIIWTHLPFYPLLVLWFVGHPVWPSFLLWLSLPVFFVVPLISTHHPTAGRILFALGGVANTLLALKAFGLPSAAGWFLVPCLIVAAVFFRLREWTISAPLTVICALAALAFGHLGGPLHPYSHKQYGDFVSLNMWCVIGLSLYLAFIAGRRHWQESSATAD